ncbi:glycoside hydrolase family 3 C-terminal domain-containing protein [Chryseobacterium sp. Leaf394]|uniref:glycoside hydrolase family 3 C-terminal domain-containing protein n=1 Tax=Chryseobacterium sp. Leaf394 TaxID=1736361 RepID=UPI0007021A45|nr:glycoside hydrolase family 3 C-terminal domain-containing protein [Chryseobacterium sp. Leaf394]KQS92396.1 glycoside hydrolase family 3 [Chryseobacterium sp. Leaf394]
MKKFIIGLGVILLTQNLHAQTDFKYPFQNPTLSREKRVENLLSLLTAEEKIGMMMNSSKAVKRLGIPAYDWWNEALHGVARAGKATVFPQAIAMAATWDVPEHLKTFEMISDEARAKYNQDLAENNVIKRYHGLSFWTPNINIFRDPRWGRGQETYGEDPYLTTQLGLAAVKGLQGDDPKYFKTHATAKHFAVHSGPEWNRHSYNATVSRKDLWETYLPAFEALVKEGNVREVMCAYNAFEGAPCCANNFLVTDILRTRWNFKGMVVSDCGAIYDFYEKKAHASHPNPETAVAAAVKHTTDVECGNSYKNLTQSLEKGLIKESELDTSLKRILTGWFELGMLDPKDANPWSKIPISVVESQKHRSQALKIAQKSMTLLKNQNQTLPLSKSIRKIAVVGPNADDGIMQLGNYNGTPSYTVTILEGIKKKIPNAEIVYERGCDLVDPSSKTSLYNSFLTEKNGVNGMKVEFFNNNEFKDKPSAVVINKTGINYNNSGGTQLAQGLNRENTSTKISGIFKSPIDGEVFLAPVASDGYSLYVDGKELLSRKGGNASKPTEVALKVEKNKEYSVELKHIQKGKQITIGFDIYRKDPLDFAAVREKVKDADAIIFAGGLSPNLEGEEMMVNAEGFKGGDKISIDLPKVQRDMLSELKKTGKPLIFVLSTGSALALEQDEKNYDALLCSWYSGQEGGNAVADVLFGDYNPAGRLPVTFYKTLAQLDNALTKISPDKQGFENYDMQGRTYRYMKESPLYAFGFGLSYSDFKYGKVKISSKKIRKEEGLKIEIPVTNQSKRDGEEVVQVYLKKNYDDKAPEKSLRAFKRIKIPAGKTEFVKLEINPQSFHFYDEKTDSLIPKSGKFTVFYGSSSDNRTLKQIQIDVR